MNKNQKKRLTTWISNFIEVAVELSADLRIPVNTSQAVLIAPADVLQILKKRDVVFENKGETFFEYESEVGPALVKVIGEKDPRFSLRLTLQQSTA